MLKRNLSSPKTFSSSPTSSYSNNKSNKPFQSNFIRNNKSSQLFKLFILLFFIIIILFILYINNNKKNENILLNNNNNIKTKHHVKEMMQEIKLLNKLENGIIIDGKPLPTIRERPFGKSVLQKMLDSELVLNKKNLDKNLEKKNEQIENIKKKSSSLNIYSQKSSSSSPPPPPPPPNVIIPITKTTNTKIKASYEVKPLKAIADIGGTEIQSLIAEPIKQDVWYSKIFVSIASFRDSECAAGIWSIMGQAINPRRITVGVMQQHDKSDGDCLSFVSSVCSKYTKHVNEYKELSDKILMSYEHLLTRQNRTIRLPFSVFGYREKNSLVSLTEILSVCTAVFNKQIIVKRVSAKEAKGPTYGRHYAQQMMTDEDFFLQVDVHSIFVAGYDAELVRTWISTKNIRTIITTYPRDLVNMKRWLLEFPPFRNRSQAVIDGYMIQKHILDSHKPKLKPYNPMEIYLPKVVPVLCHAGFVDNITGMVKLESAVEIANPMMAVQVPFWAGGLSFGSSQLVRECPYDPHTPYLFDGEEFSMAARLWTHGYDFYAPYTDIVYHPYAPPKKKPRYWEIDWSTRYPIKLKSERRIRAILGLNPRGSFDNIEIKRYGVGKWRTLDEYYQHSCIDLEKQKSYNFWEIIQKRNFPLSSCPAWPTPAPITKPPTAIPTPSPTPTPTLKSNLNNLITNAYNDNKTSKEYKTTFNIISSYKFKRRNSCCHYK